MEEVSLIKENLRVTAEKISTKSTEISNSIFKRTRDSITQINKTQINQIKEKAAGGLTTLGGKIWGVRICIIIGVVHWIK